jgi:F-type H+-transporting ATPase subunit epsilon
MRLKILLPFGVFADVGDVSRIVVDTTAGSFGLLPHRLDCVAALVAGILSYVTDSTGEVFVAVDEGTLVKTGPEVWVSVRRAQAGGDLGQLREAVAEQFMKRSDEERSVREVMARMESGFIRRMAGLHHE